MAATHVSVNLYDHSGEVTRCQFFVPAILADGSNYGAVNTAIDNLRTALLVATDCSHINTTISIQQATGTGALPAAVTAQREIAVRIKYRDQITGEIGFVTCPGPDTLFYPPQGVKGDFIPLDNAIFAAFILVIEANMKSPAGNAVDVLEGRLVGRNL